MVFHFATVKFRRELSCSPWFSRYIPNVFPINSQCILTMFPMYSQYKIYIYIYMYIFMYTFVYIPNIFPLYSHDTTIFWCLNPIFLHPFLSRLQAPKRKKLIRSVVWRGCWRREVRQCLWDSYGMFMGKYHGNVTKISCQYGSIMAIRWTYHVNILWTYHHGNIMGIHHGNIR